MLFVSTSCSLTYFLLGHLRLRQIVFSGQMYQEPLNKKRSHLAIKVVIPATDMIILTDKRLESKHPHITLLHKRNHQRIVIDIYDNINWKAEQRKMQRNEDLVQQIREMYKATVKSFLLRLEYFQQYFCLGIHLRDT